MAHFEILGWKKTDWDFVGKRYIAFAFSGLMLANGVFAMVQLARGKAKLGIDFSGGQAIQAVVEGKVDMDGVRAAFGARGMRDVQVQLATTEKGQRLLFKLRGAEASGTAAVGSGAELIRAVLGGSVGGATIVIEGVQAVGPAVGKRLQVQAGWAVLWAIVLIMVYIWIRFEYRFGLAAAIATLHDVIVVLGIMWLVGSEFSLLIVTALLTLAGYSLTDTVVVYDRIRENLRLHPADSFEVNTNRSINEVLSRTLVTSVMVMLPLISLLIYGSPVTYEFSLALTFGVIIGTYSSWYVASPIIVEWENYRRRRAARAAALRMAGRR